MTNNAYIDSQLLWLQWIPNFLGGLSLHLNHLIA